MNAPQPSEAKKERLCEFIMNREKLLNMYEVAEPKARCTQAPPVGASWILSPVGSGGG